MTRHAAVATRSSKRKVLAAELESDSAILTAKTTRTPKRKASAAHKSQRLKSAPEPMASVESPTMAPSALLIGHSVVPPLDPSPDPASPAGPAHEPTPPPSPALEHTQEPEANSAPDHTIHTAPIRWFPLPLGPILQAD